MGRPRRRSPRRVRRGRRCGRWKSGGSCRGGRGRRSRRRARRGLAREEPGPRLLLLRHAFPSQALLHAEAAASGLVRGAHNEEAQRRPTHRDAHLCSNRRVRARWAASEARVQLQFSRPAADEHFTGSSCVNGCSYKRSFPFVTACSVTNRCIDVRPPRGLSFGRRCALSVA